MRVRLSGPITSRWRTSSFPLDSAGDVLLPVLHQALQERGRARSRALVSDQMSLRERGRHPGAEVSRGAACGRERPRQRRKAGITVRHGCAGVPSFVVCRPRRASNLGPGRLAAPGHVEAEGGGARRVAPSRRRARGEGSAVGGSFRGVERRSPGLAVAARAHRRGRRGRRARIRAPARAPGGGAAAGGGRGLGHLLPGPAARADAGVHGPLPAAHACGSGRVDRAGGGAGGLRGRGRWRSRAAPPEVGEPRGARRPSSSSSSGGRGAEARRAARACSRLPPFRSAPAERGYRSGDGRSRGAPGTNARQDGQEGEAVEARGSPRRHLAPRGARRRASRAARSGRDRGRRPGERAGLRGVRRGDEARPAGRTARGSPCRPVRHGDLDGGGDGAPARRPAPRSLGPGDLPQARSAPARLPGERDRVLPGSDPARLRRGVGVRPSDDPSASGPPRLARAGAPG